MFHVAINKDIPVHHTLDNSTAKFDGQRPSHPARRQGQEVALTQTS